MIEQLICGFQTGADQGGARAAKAAGIPTGGWMPLGYRAEDGDHPEFAALYGAKQDTSRDWKPRTRLNVIDSHGSVIFLMKHSRGSALTAELCGELYRPYLQVVSFASAPVTRRQVADFIVRHSRRGLPIVNIAGNRESKAPGVGAWVEEFMGDVFRLIAGQPGERR